MRSARKGTDSQESRPAPKRRAVAPPTARRPELPPADHPEAARDAAAAASDAHPASPKAPRRRIAKRGRTEQPSEEPAEPAAAVEKEKHDVCSVCLCDTEDPSDVTLLGCGHRLHKGCVEKWSKTCNCNPPDQCAHHTTGKMQCPVCRTPTDIPADVPPNADDGSLLQLWLTLARLVDRLQSGRGAFVVDVPHSSGIVVLRVTRNDD